MGDLKRETVKTTESLVTWFSECMLKKFAEKWAKNPEADERFWADFREGRVPLGWLFHRLRDEMGELERAYLNEGPGAVIDEAADVASFAAMIAERLRGDGVGSGSKSLAK